MRQRLLRFSVLLPLIAVVFVAGFSALPSRTAHACLPCSCETLRSVNCFGPYALYTPTHTNGTCDLDIWVVEADGHGERALLQTAAQLAKVPEVPDDQNYVTIKTALDGFISLYKLKSGEYQINVGPTVENKVYTLNFTGCPPEDVHEGNYVNE